MVGGICLRTGIRQRSKCHDSTRWQIAVLVSLIITPCHCVHPHVLVCLRDSSPVKTACGVVLVAFLVSPDTRESSATSKCSRSICPMPVTPLVVLANGIWEHNRENSPMIVALMSFAGSLVDRVPIG